MICSDCNHCQQARNANLIFCKEHKRHFRWNDLACNLFSPVDPLKALAELTKQYREGRDGT